jgi:serine phosphatase RsbU (regulator of sigma subunit)
MAPARAIPRTHLCMTASRNIVEAVRRRNPIGPSGPGHGLRARAARVSLIVAIGGVAVGLALGLLLSAIVQLRSTSAATQRAGTLLERVLVLEGSVVDAETALRGYAITRAGVFLGPLRAAQRELPREERSLVATAVRDGEFVARSRALAAAARRYMTGYVQDELSLARTTPSAARSLAVTLLGKQRVDAIRAQSAALEGALTAEQARRQRASQSTADDAETEAIISLVLVVLLTLAVGAVLGRLTLARERALESATSTARTLQTSLLPLAVPQIPGCELAIRFTPAAGLVGGDFYDVFSIDGEREWAIVVGDVCGKGAEAAATTAVARWTLRSGTALTEAPADALQHLNNVMRARGRRALFATIAYLRLTLAPDEAQLTIACAGHPAPVLVRPGREPHVVDAGGDLVGIWPDPRLHTSELRLAPGDVVVVYTDGAIAHADDALEPIARLAGRAELDPERIAGGIERLALQRVDAARDDIAVLALRFVGGAGAADGASEAAAGGRTGA